MTTFEVAPLSTGLWQAVKHTPGYCTVLGTFDTEDEAHDKVTEHQAIRLV